MPERLIDLVRLTQVPLAEVVALLNEPRNARHMPLSDRFTDESAAAWVAAKDAQWDEHGYGPWAVLVDGELAGWGGFQREDNGADFALVLLPKHWGVGLEITRAALDRGFRELGLDSVIIALPFTRSPQRAVARLGFAPDGEVSYGGSDFRQFRLTRAAWEAAQSVLLLAPPLAPRSGPARCKEQQGVQEPSSHGLGDGRIELRPADG